MAGAPDASAAENDPAAAAAEEVAELSAHQVAEAIEEWKTTLEGKTKGEMLATDGFALPSTKRKDSTWQHGVLAVTKENDIVKRLGDKAPSYICVRDCGDLNEADADEGTQLLEDMILLQQHQQRA